MNNMPMCESKLLYVAQPAVRTMAKSMCGMQAVPCGGQVSTKCIGMPVRQGLPPTQGEVFRQQACEERERRVLVNQCFRSDQIVQGQFHKRPCSVSEPIVDVHGALIEGASWSVEAGGPPNSQACKMDGHDGGVGWEGWNHQSWQWVLRLCFASFANPSVDEPEILKLCSPSLSLVHASRHSVAFIGLVRF
jgi:hypothetical protein